GYRARESLRGSDRDPVASPVDRDRASWIGGRPWPRSERHGRGVSSGGTPVERGTGGEVRSSAGRLSRRWYRSSAVGAATGGPNDGGDVVRDGLLTDSQTMMGWIAEITAQGIRRPGYPASEWIEGWARDRFVELGLEDVTLDPVTVDRWEPLDWSLTLSRPDG